MVSLKVFLAAAAARESPAGWIERHPPNLPMRLLQLFQQRWLLPQQRMVDYNSIYLAQASADDHGCCRM
jgi:hypothetical protein